MTQRSLNGLCHVCAISLSCNDQLRCPRCDRPRWQHKRCPSCRRYPPHFKQLRAPMLYGGAFRDMILGFKFQRRFDWLPHLCAPLLHDPTALQLAAECDVLIPIPLSHTRLRQRGYNQSALISRYLAQCWQLPSHDVALQRQQHHPPQSKATPQQRRKQIRGQFSLAPHAHAALHRKRLLLIDDVVTTGATLDEAARTLRTAQPQRIDAITLAVTDPCI